MASIRLDIAIPTDAAIAAAKSAGEQIGKSIGAGVVAGVSTAETALKSLETTINKFKSIGISDPFANWGKSIGVIEARLGTMTREIERVQGLMGRIGGGAGPIGISTGAAPEQAAKQFAAVESSASKAATAATAGLQQIGAGSERAAAQVNSLYLNFRRVAGSILALAGTVYVFDRIGSGIERALVSPIERVINATSDENRFKLSIQGISGGPANAEAINRSLISNLNNTPYSLAEARQLVQDMTKIAPIAVQLAGATAGQAGNIVNGYENTISGLRALNPQSTNEQILHGIEGALLGQGRGLRSVVQIDPDQLAQLVGRSGQSAFRGDPSALIDALNKYVRLFGPTNATGQLNQFPDVQFQHIRDQLSQSLAQVGNSGVFSVVVDQARQAANALAQYFDPKNSQWLDHAKSISESLSVVVRNVGDAILTFFEHLAGVKDHAQTIEGTVDAADSYFRRLASVSSVLHNAAAIGGEAAAKLGSALSHLVQVMVGTLESVEEMQARHATPWFPAKQEREARTEAFINLYRSVVGPDDNVREELNLANAQGSVGAPLTPQLEFIRRAYAATGPYAVQRDAAGNALPQFASPTKIGQIWRLMAPQYGQTTLPTMEQLFALNGSATSPDAIFAADTASSITGSPSRRLSMANSDTAMLRTVAMRTLLDELATAGQSGTAGQMQSAQVDVLRKMMSQGIPGPETAAGANATAWKTAGAFQSSLMSGDWRDWLGMSGAVSDQSAYAASISGFPDTLRRNVSSAALAAALKGRGDQLPNMGMQVLFGQSPQQSLASQMVGSGNWLSGLDDESVARVLAARLRQNNQLGADIQHYGGNVTPSTSTASLLRFASTPEQSSLLGGTGRAQQEMALYQQKLAEILPLMDQLRVTQGADSEAFKEAALSVAEYSQKITDLAPKVNATTEAFIKFGNSVQSSLSSGLGQVLTDIELKTGNVRDALRSLGREMLTSFNRSAVEGISGSLFGSPNGKSGAGNGIGGLLGGLFSMFMPSPMKPGGPAPFVGDITMMQPPKPGDSTFQRWFGAGQGNAIGASLLSAIANGIGAAFGAPGAGTVGVNAGLSAGGSLPTSFSSNPMENYFAGDSSGAWAGFNAPPAYASGGVVNSAHIGVVGESGKEAIVPMPHGYLPVSVDGGSVTLPGGGRIPLGRSAFHSEGGIFGAMGSRISGAGSVPSAYGPNASHGDVNVEQKIFHIQDESELFLRGYKKWRDVVIRDVGKESRPGGKLSGRRT